MYTVSANTLEASVGVIYTGNMWQQEPSKVVPYDDMVVKVLVVVVLRVGECSCPFSARANNVRPGNTVARAGAEKALPDSNAMRKEPSEDHRCLQIGIAV